MFRIFLFTYCRVYVIGVFQVLCHSIHFISFIQSASHSCISSNIISCFSNNMMPVFSFYILISLYFPFLFYFSFLIVFCYSFFFFFYCCTSHSISRIFVRFSVFFFSIQLLSSCWGIWMEQEEVLYIHILVASMSACYGYNSLMKLKYHFKDKMECMHVYRFDLFCFALQYSTLSFYPYTCLLFLLLLLLLLSLAQYKV